MKNITEVQSVFVKVPGCSDPSETARAVMEAIKDLPNNPDVGANGGDVHVEHVEVRIMGDADPARVSNAARAAIAGLPEQASHLTIVVNGNPVPRRRGEEPVVDLDEVPVDSDE